jgi:hypothetical protein
MGGHTHVTMASTPIVGKKESPDPRSSALGHVWTAPWQELSDVLQHWSGAVTRRAC